MGFELRGLELEIAKDGDLLRTSVDGIPNKGRGMLRGTYLCTRCVGSNKSGQPNGHHVKHRLPTHI